MTKFLPFKEDYSFKQIDYLYEIETFSDAVVKSNWKYTTDNIDDHKKAIG